MIEWCSPLFGILGSLFGQLLCEASVESFDGREWRPVPLSDPSDIELVRGGFTECEVGSCCRFLLLWLWEWEWGLWLWVGLRRGAQVEVDCIPMLALLFTRLTSGVRCIYELV